MPSVLASWYGDPTRRRDNFHTLQTASGERMNGHAFTVAHPNINPEKRPWVEVTYTDPDDGITRTIEARVTDAGPYHGNRGLDVSYASAVILGLEDEGEGTVTMRRIDGPTNRYAQQRDEYYIDNYFPSVLPPLEGGTRLVDSPRWTPGQDRLQVMTEAEFKAENSRYYLNNWNFKDDDGRLAVAVRVFPDLPEAHPNSDIQWETKLDDPLRPPYVVMIYDTPENVAEYISTHLEQTGLVDAETLDVDLANAAWSRRSYQYELDTP
jgi:hypothetical protein